MFVKKTKTKSIKKLTTKKHLVSDLFSIINKNSEAELSLLKYAIFMII